MVGCVQEACDDKVGGLLGWCLVSGGGGIGRWGVGVRHGEWRDGWGTLEGGLRQGGANAITWLAATGGWATRRGSCRMGAVGPAPLLPASP